MDGTKLILFTFSAYKSSILKYCNEKDSFNTWMSSWHNIVIYIIDNAVCESLYGNKQALSWRSPIQNVGHLLYWLIDYWLTSSEQYFKLFDEIF
jgi:hypothetical protein